MASALPGGRRCGASGQGQEDIVEVGRLDGQRLDFDRARIEPIEQGRRQWTLPSLDAPGRALVVAGAAAEQRGRSVEPGGVAELEADAAAGHEPLELGRRTLGDDPAAVEQGDPDASRSASSRYCVVRKIVTPSATSSRTMSHITRRLRGSRPVVGSSRKMIRGSPTSVIARSSRRRMPPSMSSPASSAASTRSNCSSSSATRVGPPRSQVLEVGHQAQVLLAGELAVDRRDLAGQADGLAHGVRPRRRRSRRSTPRHRPGISVERYGSRWSCRHRSGRAGRTRCLRDVEVDAVEDDLLAVGLA